MPNLRNIQGSSLVTNLNEALLSGRTAFDRAQAQKDKALADELAAKKRIDTEESLQTISNPEASQQEQNAAFNRIATLDPNAARVIQQGMLRGDTNELTELQQQSDNAHKFSSFVLSLDKSDRRSAIVNEIKQRIADGKPTKKLFALADLDLDRMEIGLRKMNILSKDSGDIAKENLELIKQNNQLANQDQFVSALDGDGNIVGQVNLKTGEIKKSPLAGDGEAEKGTFTKGNSTRIKNPDGSISLATQITDTRSGKTVNAITPLPTGTRIVSSQFGETAEQETSRKIVQAGGEKSAELDAVTTKGGAAEGAKVAGKSKENRRQAVIDNGVSRAGALPVIVRGLELLNTVKTGGFNKAALAFKQTFGIESADEAELANNLGKAVLSQLRTTFGAQFTEREGALLQSIEAGFGKSTAGNIRLLKQAEKIIRDTARRGINAAVAAGDFQAAADIKESMELSLTPQEDNVPAGQSGAVATGQKTPEGFEIFQRPDGSTFAVKP